MAGTYLFNCPSCSATNELSLKQAGQELPCSECNAAFDAPKLGDIKKLPTKGPIEVAKGTKHYSPLQGWLFAGGITLAVIAGLAGWQLYSYGSSLATELDVDAEIAEFNKEMDERTPAQVYMLGRLGTDSMGLEYQEPEYRRLDKQSAILKNFSYGVFALCGIGLLMLICSFLIRPSS